MSSVLVISSRNKEEDLQTFSMPFNRVMFLWPRPTKIFGMCHLWHCSNSEQCDTIISRQLSNALTYTHTVACREYHADAASSVLCYMEYPIYATIYAMMHELSTPRGGRGKSTKIQDQDQAGGPGSAGSEHVIRFSFNGN